MTDFVCYAGIWITDSGYEQDQKVVAINDNEKYVPVLQSVLQSRALPKTCYISCIFSEFVISQLTLGCSSRTRIHKRVSVGGRSVETLTRYVRIFKFSS
jgi:hypothetical protein